MTNLSDFTSGDKTSIHDESNGILLERFMLKVV